MDSNKEFIQLPLISKDKCSTSLNTKFLLQVLEEQLFSPYDQKATFLFSI